MTIEVAPDRKIRLTPDSIHNDDNVNTEVQVNKEEAMCELEVEVQDQENEEEAMCEHGLAIIYDKIEPKGFCSHGKLTEENAYVTPVPEELV